ncbi:MULTISPECIES: rhodanese-like domain-containing protein [Bifidobacterium]|uniref:Rhodanese-like domain-containing protein n=2 Tax=Bifidobacterium TaxID=1678 RepID=A0A430FCQ7_9BIFI|nr:MULTISPECIES: rhodanese-like domain-containing protein [Bifidobacterium]MBT1176723.1 rhodanese-like domain-containing protein [Bifidobacterium callimiconis]OXM99428.1 rhodanese-like domain-containing protein [Bifidobacterium vansinderenii]RSX50623.1 rhodanese-like domain-containing protein [Bifidobacterium callimiconis]
MIGNEFDEVEIRQMSPEEFAALDYSTVTLLDLREPHEVAAHGIEGAINAPFDPLAKVLHTVPKDKPVIVFCREGSWSEEVAEILMDRGYDAVNLTGGFQAYERYLAQRG